MISNWELKLKISFVLTVGAMEFEQLVRLISKSEVPSSNHGIAK